MKNRFFYLLLFSLCPNIILASQALDDQRDSQALSNYQNIVQEKEYEKAAFDLYNQKFLHTHSEKQDKASLIDDFLTEHPEWVNKPIGKEHSKENPLSLAILYNDNETLDVLFKHRVNTQHQISDLHLPAIHLAAHYANKYAVQKLLEQDKNLASNIEESGLTTPLHQLLLQNTDLLQDSRKISSFEIAEETFSIAKVLIDAISDPNILNKQDDAARTFLHLAVVNGNVDIVNLLLHRKDINLSLKDINNYTAFDYAVACKNIEIIKAFFKKGIVCFIGNDNLIKFVNNDKSLDLNYLLFRNTVIHAQSFLAITQILIEKGADIHAKDNNGNTALIYAACNNHLDIAQLLIKKGAGVCAKNNFGKTALMDAALNNNLDIAQLLIENGADIQAKANDGDTALDIARRCNYRELITLLSKNTSCSDCYMQ